MFKNHSHRDGHNDDPMKRSPHDLTIYLEVRLTRLATGSDRSKDTKQARDETVPDTARLLQLRFIEILRRDQFPELSHGGSYGGIDGGIARSRSKEEQ